MAMKDKDLGRISGWSRPERTGGFAPKMYLYNSSFFTLIVCELGIFWDGSLPYP